MSSILIIKTGQTVETARTQVGDFEDWIIEAMERPREDFRVAAVYHGDALPDYDTVDGVVITGSAAMVTDRLDWSEKAAQWLRGLSGKSIPTLGICYGHQLLAHAFGGKVAANPGGREIGTVPIRLMEAATRDRLFSETPSSLQAHSSHMQSVIEPPPSAVVLAANDFDAHHALRLEEGIWGVQFHPEFDEVVMQAYITERRDALIREKLDPDRLLAKVQETPVARNLLARFSSFIG